MKFAKATSIIAALSGFAISSVTAFRGSQILDADGKASQVHRNLEQTAQDYTCTGGQDYSIYFKGKCDYDHLVKRMDLKVAENSRCVNSGAKEVQLLAGIIAGESDPNAIHEAKKAVDKLCRAAMDIVMKDPNKVVQWNNVNGQVTNKGSNFDQEYFDGNSFWNEEYQTNYDTLIPDEPSNVLRRDAERVDDLYETVAERVPFEWPSHVDNFDNCEIRAAMCCWVSDRQAGDNNGNCNTPYDQNCLDADPADNTELCAVDMSRSPESVHVNDGISIYAGGYNGLDGNARDTEGPTHCHGFAWGLDQYEADARYKANNLFYVSMYDHMYQRGYVRNVPGAPMCGCVEKMPIVSRADCTEIEAKEFWRFDWSVTSQSFTAVLDRTEIDFNACRGAGRNNDLASFYQRLYNEGRATWDEREQLRRTVVGDNRCYEAVEAMMFDKGFEEYYPSVPIVDTLEYSIKIYDGTQTGRDYLFSSYSGDVQLVGSIMNNAAKWKFEKLDGSGSFFNIRPVGNVESDETFLSADHHGHVDMYDRDDNSGRQKWHLKQVNPKYVMGKTNVYNIMMNSGVRNGEHYLSTNTSGNPDLYDNDDLSGRQRWVIEAL